MLYQLNIVDRIVLGQVLAQIGGPGNWLYQKELRQAREKMSFTEKQWKECGMAHVMKDGKPTGGIRWDPDKADKAIIKVEIGERIKNEIAQVLKKLDEQEQLMPEHYDTFLMFVGDAGPEEEVLGCEERPLT